MHVYSDHSPVTTIVKYITSIDIIDIIDTYVHIFIYIKYYKTLK